MTRYVRHSPKITEVDHWTSREVVENAPFYVDLTTQAKQAQSRSDLVAAELV